MSKADVIKHMLSMLILNERMGKWILALSEFDLRYESAKAVKGQVMADFITQHHKPSIGYVEPMPCEHIGWLAMDRLNHHLMS